MKDLGGPISRSESAEKLEQYRECWGTLGYGRWCVTDPFGEVLGYVGVRRESSDHPLGEHDEIGWRLDDKAWGKGYAVEAASAAITDAFQRCGLKEILTYTTRDNMNSQTVINKLPFQRKPELDFSVPWPATVEWKGLVWSTNPELASELL